jgi:hypothetical protein
MKISGLPDMFNSVNENFHTAAIEGALVMVRDYTNLDALPSATAESGVDILAIECGVRRAAWAVLKKWWPSFSYDYVLAATHATD